MLSYLTAFGFQLEQSQKPYILFSSLNRLHYRKGLQIA